ncbi:hypothetical protein ACFL5I_01300 [Planctomycetota bacterium]
MGFFEKLLNIDRRIIFLFIGVVVIASYFIRITLPIKYTAPVKDIYDFIEDQEEGACIMVAFDYSPDSMPELNPMSLSFLRHCFKKKLKVIAMTLWAPGAGLAEEALATTAEEFGAKPEIDYVNLGYKFGTVAVMLGLGSSIVDTFPLDYNKKSTKDMPIFKKIKNYKDVTLLMDFAAGATPEEWVVYAYTKYDQRLAAGVTAVMAADYYPYLDTGQLVGLINGLKGAAEYENLMGKPGEATRGMTPQSAVHLVIIFFIVIGNIGYFMVLRKKGAK